MAKPSCFYYFVFHMSTQFVFNFGHRVPQISLTAPSEPVSFIFALLY